MSQVKAFYEALVKDKSLQKEAIALNKKAIPDDQSATAKLIMDFAASKGFTFTEVELEEFLQNHQNDELGIEELDAVAGGRSHYICLVSGPRV